MIHISPTQLDLSEQCLRKWAFKYIAKIPEPQGKARADGERLHAKVEAWLRDGIHPGDDREGKLIQAAMRPGLLPTPGPNVYPERPFTIALDDGHEMVGKIDCASIETPRVVVIDHKFVKALVWAKTVEQLKNDSQARVYGKAAIINVPAATTIERRWLYYQKEGKIDVLPVSFCQTPVEVEAAWLPVRANAMALVELRLRSVPPRQLKGNPEACDMFRGCPYRHLCDVGRSAGRFSFTPNANNAINANQQGGIMQSLQQQLEALKAKAQAKSEPAQAQPATLAQKQAQFGATGVNPPPVQAASQAKPAWVGTPTQAPAATPAKPQTATLPWGAPVQPAPSTAQPAQSTPPSRASWGVPQDLAQIPAAWGGAPTAVAPPAQEAPASSIAPWGAPAAQAVQTVETEVNTQLAAAAKEKKPRKQTQAAAPASAPAGQLSVLFSASVIKFPDTNQKPTQLIDLLAPVMRKVADENNVAHWALIPFAQGKALLAHAFDAWLNETPWKGTLIVGDSDEARAVHEVLIAHADVVVRGTR